jgi:CubicO group peptidase (beta-lactamase class C family)
MNRFTAAARLLTHAVEERITPAAVIEVGRGRGVEWRQAFGRLTYEPDAPAAAEDTIFDLASLTKVIATTALAMRAMEEGRLMVGSRAGQFLREWRGADREDVTVRDLLAHCGGLTAYLPFYTDPDMRGRAAFEHAISKLALEYCPRTQAIYSDLGFILLGFILEDAFGAPLDGLFDGLRGSFTGDVLRFNPPASLRPRVAPTESDPWRGRLLVGEAHDENCWSLGGVAGHAGLFGTAAAVGDFARLVLATFDADTPLARRATLGTFAARTTDVPDSSRALGWDTMLPTSSCGTRLSARAIGHTGFTGTSLWIDPGRDVYIVLLTNRVHPTRQNDRLKGMRGRIHDAVMEEFGNFANW